MKSIIRDMSGEKVLVLIPENDDEREFIKQAHEKFEKGGVPIVARFIMDAKTELNTTGDNKKIGVKTL